jgi:hypothetical protein
LRVLRFSSFDHASTAAAGCRQNKRQTQNTQMTAKRRKGVRAKIIGRNTTVHVNSRSISGNDLKRDQWMSRPIADQVASL